MPKCIGKEVPFFSFQNPGGQILYPDGLFTYAIGNTTAQQLAERLATNKGCALNVLLLGSGDLRNVFFTVSELWQRKTSLRPGQVYFHVNDFDPVVVARNVIILQIASCIDPELPEDVDFLWNVWYNMSLSEDHYQRLLRVMEDLISHYNFENGFKFGAEETRDECRRVWRDWATVSRSIDDVRTERRRFISKYTQERCGYQPENPGNDTREEFKKVVKGFVFNAYVDLFRDHGKALPALEEEIQNVYLTGSTSADTDRINPTLLRPFSHNWRNHYSSYCFQGYSPFEREIVEKHGTITDTCKALLKEKITDFQQLSSSKQPVKPVQVTFWLGDALELCTSTLKQDEAFDIIATSNLADHIGLLNVLVCCESRLKRPNQSQLLTSTMVWSRATNSIDEYLNESVGIHSHLMPTVLGLKLADDLQLGRGTLGNSSGLVDGSRDEILTWVKADQERTPISIERSDDVVAAFQILAKRCFLLPNQTSSDVDKATSGIRLSSPTTFLRIIQQAAPALDEPATVLLDRVVDSLPKVQVGSNPTRQPLFDLTWNVIKHVTEASKETVLEILVEASSSMIVYSSVIAFLFENPADAAILNVTFFTGIISQTYRGRVHLLSHNVRYNIDTNVLTFHVLEKDWKALPSSTVVVVSNLLTSQSLAPVCITSSATTVTPVDIKKVYGLEQIPSVVRAETKSDVLELVHFGENTFNYDAELKMIGDSSQKGSLSTRFTPKYFPTVIELTFSGESKSTKLYLSSPVDERMCKFQISRKRARIFCQFLKTLFGLVGEACIQNPAVLDIDKCPPWKGCRNDLGIILGRMFSTKSSLAMKEKMDIEPTFGKEPFYDLQETIQSVILQYVEHGQERNVFRVIDPSVDKTEADITIVVQGVYKYKFMPLVKVLFADHAAAWDLVTRNPSIQSLNCQKYVMVIQAAGEKEGYPYISATQQEQVLLKRLLYTNALRLKQPNELSPVWIQSFLHPRYPRQTSGFTSNELKAEIPIKTFEEAMRLVEAPEIPTETFEEAMRLVEFPETTTETIEEAMRLVEAPEITTETIEEAMRLVEAPEITTERIEEAMRLVEAPEIQTETIEEAMRLVEAPEIPTKVMEEAMQLVEVPQQLPAVADKGDVFFNSAKNLADGSARKCASCHKVLDKAKKCSGCGNVYYCNRQCQRSHWKKHRSVCKWKKR